MQRAHASSSRRRIFWPTAVLLVIVVLVLGAFNAAALPGCASCHDRGDFRPETADSAHSTVDCRSCHVPAAVLDRVAFSLRQPLHMYVPISGGGGRDSAAVPDSRCLACHDDVLTTVVTSNGIRVAHETCATGAACSGCHAGTAHGTAVSWMRTYDMERCLACHVGAEQPACDLCHEGRRPANRITSGSFAVTHGAQWRSTHGMGDAATCMVCHQQDDCAKCHGAGLPHGARFVETHAQYVAQPGAQCASCHAASFCDACHGIPMPHTDAFTRDHATIGAGEPASCDRCHAESDCTICHEKHIHPGGAVGGAPAGGGEG